MSLAATMLGCACSHGAVIISASPDRYVNGIAIVRLGDLVDCPLPGHGVNPIVSVATTTVTDGKPNAHIGAVAACGAVVASGSSNTYVG